MSGGGGGRNRRLEELQEQTLEDEIQRREDLEADLETRRRLRSLGGRRGQLRFFGPGRIRRTAERREPATVATQPTPRAPTRAPRSQRGGEGRGGDTGGVGGAGPSGGGDAGGGGPGSGGGSQGGGGSACFLAGTPILMADGTTKPIEQIDIGDVVASYPETLLDYRSSPSLHPGEVVGVLKARKPTFVQFTGPSGPVQCTPEHPFLTSDDDFRPIGDFDQFTRAVTEDGMPADLGEIETFEENVTVFNFTVWPSHTYVAGGLRVHNVKD